MSAQPKPTVQFVRTGFAENESSSDPDAPSPSSKRRISFGGEVIADAPIHSSPSDSSESSGSSSPASSDDDDEKGKSRGGGGGGLRGEPQSPSGAGSGDDLDDERMLLREQQLQEQSAKEDPRLQDALRLVRKLSSAKLKEQCLVTEWAAARTDVEREILLEAVADPSFWDEVKNMANADVDAVPDEEDDVDTETRLYQMFKCFDRDESGSIGPNELHQMLLYMGISASEDEVEQLVKQFDCDCDGRIDQGEFMLVMKRAQAGQLSIAAPTKQTIRRASFRVTQNRPVFPRSELRVDS